MTDNNNARWKPEINNTRVYWLDSSGSVVWPIVGTYDYGHEHAGCTKVGSLVKHLSQRHLVKKDSAPRSWLDNSYTGTTRHWVYSHSRIETSVIERHCCRLPVMGEVDLSACCHGNVTWGSIQLGLRDGTLIATKKLLWDEVIRRTHTWKMLHKGDDIGCNKWYWVSLLESQSAKGRGRKGDGQDRRKSEIGKTEWRSKYRNTENKETRRNEEHKKRRKTGENPYRKKEPKSEAETNWKIPRVLTRYSP